MNLKHLRVGLLLGFISLASFGQEKDQPYPVLKQLKEKDLASEVLPMSNKKGQWGFANEKDNFVIKPVFDRVGPFKTDRSTANRTLAKVTSGGKEGYLKRDATYLIPPVYDSLSGFEDGVVYFTKDGEKGFIDIEGSVIAEDLDDIKPFFSRDYTWCLQDGLWGVIGKDGEFLILPIFTKEPVAINPKVWLVQTRDKQGLLDAKDFSDILPVDFDQIVQDQNKHLLYAQREGRYAVFSPEGKQLSDFALKRLPVFQGNVMKFIYGGKPWLLLSDGLCLQADEYEKKLRSSASEKNYVGNTILPDQMKPFGSYNRESDKNHALKLPSSGRGNVDFYYPFGEIKRSDDGVWCSDTELQGSVVLDRTCEVLSCSGSIYHTQLKDLMIMLASDGGIKIGGALSSLFRTVNSNRVSAFDRKRGTDLMRSWRSLTFDLYFGGWQGEYVLYAVNMFIDTSYQSYFVQRWYVLFDVNTEQVVARWCEDGEVNNPEHPVSRNSFFCRLIDGGRVLVTEDTGADSEYGLRIYKTTLRDSRGAILGTYSDNFLPYVVATGKDCIQLFGVGPYGDAYEGGPAMGGDESICFSNDGTVSRCGLAQTVSGWKRGVSFFEYGESFIAISVPGDSGGIVTICPVGPGVSRPALKYQEIPWGDDIILAVAHNYYHPNSWILFTNDPEEGLSLYREMSDVSLMEKFKLLSTSPDEEGYYRYAYSPYSGGTQFCGYFGNGKITQAVFEKAGPFENGKAEVVINGVRKYLTLKEMEQYLSK